MAKVESIAVPGATWSGYTCQACGGWVQHGSFHTCLEYRAWGQAPQTQIPGADPRVFDELAAIRAELRAANDLLAKLLAAFTDPTTGGGA